MIRLLVALAFLTATGTPAFPDVLRIASFNIKWLGYYSEERRNEALAEMLKAFDIVVVQELVAPPYPGYFPREEDNLSKSADRARTAACRFFEAMRSVGFSRPNPQGTLDGHGDCSKRGELPNRQTVPAFLLSPADTGPGDTNGKHSARTEWFVAFFKPSRVVPANDLPSGFLADDLTANPDYQRVPYAFGFRVPATRQDLVLIAVHLQPDATSAARKRRAHELKSIASWVNNTAKSQNEQDFIILGDTNIQSCKELNAILPAGWTALNDECRDTATAKVKRPYDHVFYLDNSSGKEIDKEFDLHVINLVDHMRDDWKAWREDTYPGDPYTSKKFPKYYSDHHPIHFQIKLVADDD